MNAEPMVTVGPRSLCEVVGAHLKQVCHLSLLLIHGFQQSGGRIMATACRRSATCGPLRGRLTRGTSIVASPSRAIISTAAASTSTAARWPWRPLRSRRILPPLCVLIRTLSRVRRRWRWRWRRLPSRRLLLRLRPLLWPRRCGPGVSIATVPFIPMVTPGRCGSFYSGLRQRSHRRPHFRHSLRRHMRRPNT